MQKSSRKPYWRILGISIALTILYFWMEDRPDYITYQEDQRNILFYGVLYVVLLFATISAVYTYFKKSRP
jgi:hypothetical protein